MADFVNEFFTLMMMALALGMDAFSISLGMGMLKLGFRQIFHVGFVVGLFHLVMPLLGMLVGHTMSDTFGKITVYIGGVLLIVLGAQMIISGFKREENSIIAPVGLGLFLFAISVSLDSFSIGMTLGIYGARTAPVLISFGLSSAIMTWIGLLMGRKARHLVGAYGEAIGGGILLAFGLKLLLPFI